MSQQSVSDFQIHAVESNEVQTLLPYISDLLEKAIFNDQNKYNINHLANDIMDGKKQLFVITQGTCVKNKIDIDLIEGIIVTELVLCPLQHVINVCLIMGEHIEQWIHLINDLIKIMQDSMRFDLIEIQSQGPWAVDLQSHGFSKISTLWSKSLSKKFNNGA